MVDRSKLSNSKVTREKEKEKEKKQRKRKRKSKSRSKSRSRSKRQTQNWSKEKRTFDATREKEKEKEKEKQRHYWKSKSKSKSKSRSSNNKSTSKKQDINNDNSKKAWTQQEDDYLSKRWYNKYEKCFDNCTLTIKKICQNISDEMDKDIGSKRNLDTIEQRLRLKFKSTNTIIKQQENSNDTHNIQASITMDQPPYKRQRLLN